MSKAVTLIRSSTLFDSAEYAYAATAPAAARLIFLAGSCPLDKDGSTVGIGDYAAQAAKCIENMHTALADAGASIEDVISTRVLVASTRQADLVPHGRSFATPSVSTPCPAHCSASPYSATTTSLSRSGRSPRSASDTWSVPG